MIGHGATKVQSLNRSNLSAVVFKDLNPLIIRGNFFLAFKNDDFLRQVQIAERGRSLLWPDRLEFCADALKLSVGQ